MIGGELAAIMKCTQKRLKLGPLKCLHYLFYPNRVDFFSTRTIFTRARTNLAEGPSTGKNFGSARMKFITDRLFTLQVLPESNLFFLGPVPISPEPRQKLFCSVNRALNTVTVHLLLRIQCETELRSVRSTK